MVTFGNDHDDCHLFKGGSVEERAIEQMRHAEYHGWRVSATVTRLG